MLRVRVLLCFGGGGEAYGWGAPEGALVLMGQKTYFAVVGIIFALVALAHADLSGVASHN